MQETQSAAVFTAFAEKMRKEGLPQVVIDTFAAYYREVMSGEKGMIPGRSIRPVTPSEIGDYENLEAVTETGVQALGKTVMIRLNGGLGTSMGLTGPKSLIDAGGGRSFLEIIVNQAQRRDVCLCLMNSFSTQADTLAALGKLEPARDPLLFVQNKYPKVLQDDFTPARWPTNPALEWNPPGHGDIYTALYTSGVLEQLLAQGIEYAFMANIDNLGAVMDAALLGYFAGGGFPFMMEIAEKTPSDVKGGHLARLGDGRFVLRESAQCPSDELESFRDIRRYRYFNTNNIWVNLTALREMFARRGMVRLPLIVNPKTLDPRDENSPKVYQIETAMGSAISLFEGATAVRVPRSRFLPVKKCNDLLALRSDCFMLCKDGEVKASPLRKLGAIRIQLDERYYSKIDAFDARFPHGPPSLVDCASLIVEGDVVFGEGVKIVGDVKIVNRRHFPVTVKAGSILNRDISL